MARSMVAESRGGYVAGEEEKLMLHYLMWGKPGPKLDLDSMDAAFAQLGRNTTVMADLEEVAAWRRGRTTVLGADAGLPYACPLELHGSYGSGEIKAAFGMCSFEKPGPTGVGVIHVPKRRTYLHLVTLKKSESDFQPTTMYRDYPISRTRLHWESQSTLALHHETARNYIEWKARGYTILFFVRMEKKMSGLPSPFIFLGPASDLVSHSGERPVAMVWDLAHPMPAALFEQAREGG